LASLYRYIGFEGPMGSGKRDLARRVATAMTAEYVQDIKENPFLEAFYKNKPGAAFQAQLFSLLNRYQILQDLAQPNLFRQTMISDFIIDKDRIYAYQNLSDSELMIYERLYGLLNATPIKPDLVVYFQLSPRKIMERLRKSRGKSLFTISEEYVESVVEGYNRFFFRYTETPLIILNADDVAFERDRVAFDDFLSFLNRRHRGVIYFTPQTGK